jgi:hypothetical protein
MTVNKVSKDQNIEVSKERVNKSSRKFSRYELDAFFIAYGYILFCTVPFLDINILSMLAIYLFLPFLKIIAEKLVLKHSGIAIFRGDIIELVSLLNREGFNLISSNNIYTFSSSKLSLIPQVSCIAEVVGEGIKMTTEQFLLEKWVANDGRINLIKEFDVGIKNKKSATKPEERRK